MYSLCISMLEAQDLLASSGYECNCGAPGRFPRFWLVVRVRTGFPVSGTVICLTPGHRHRKMGGFCVQVLGILNDRVVYRGMTARRLLV